MIWPVSKPGCRSWPWRLCSWAGQAGDNGPGFMQGSLDCLAVLPWRLGDGLHLLKDQEMEDSSETQWSFPGAEEYCGH